MKHAKIAFVVSLLKHAGKTGGEPNKFLSKLAPENLSI